MGTSIAQVTRVGNALRLAVLEKIGCRTSEAFCPIEVAGYASAEVDAEVDALRHEGHLNALRLRAPAGEADDPWVPSTLTRSGRQLLRDSRHTAGG